MPKLIKPHGSEALNPLFVYDSAENERLRKEAETLPSIVVSSAAAANAVMLGGGYFNPLTGYMNKADALSVARDHENDRRPVLAGADRQSASRTRPASRRATASRSGTRMCPARRSWRS